MKMLGLAVRSQQRENNAQLSESQTNSIITSQFDSFQRFLIKCVRVPLYTSVESLFYGRLENPIFNF